MISFVEINEYELVKKSIAYFAQTIFSDLENRVDSIDKYAEKIYENGKCILCRKNSEMIGIAAFYCNDFKTKSGYITLIGLLPSYQGKGIGKELLKFCCNTMFSCGMCKVKLEVSKSNKTAIKFYEINGFKMVDCSRGGIIWNTYSIKLGCNPSIS